MGTIYVCSRCHKSFDSEKKAEGHVARSHVGGTIIYRYTAKAHRVKK
jgi:hypothetical protein